MKRRQFLQSLAAVAASIAVPLSPADSPFAALARLKSELIDNMRLADADYYVGFVHPSVYVDLLRMVARDGWNMSYRRARVAGDRHLSPRDILAKYPTEPMPTEFGSYEGFRFITSGGIYK